MRALPVAAALWCAVLSAACDPPGPGLDAARRVELAAGFRPQPLEKLVRDLEARVEPPRASRIVRRGEGDAELWLEVELPRALWTPGPAAYEWRAPLPAGGAMLVCDKRSMVLESGERSWRRALRRQLSPLVYVDRFQIVDDAALSLFLESGEPENMLCRARLDHGKLVDGRWRVAQGGLVCNGLLVFPGVPETVECEIPPASALFFATVAPESQAVDQSPTRFRVKLDGRTLLEHAQQLATPLRAESHALALDAAGAHRLTFEVEGDSPALFAAPVVAPVENGRPGARPWPEDRPDIVLLLCDTFRADNLAAWSGSPELAPNLNALVERSLRFLDARATAAWTLPSVGTLMTGLFPGQHGGTDVDRGIGADLETLPAVLARHGYRTAAITDAGLFSRQFGQDHGFEWFEETTVTEWNLDHTLAKARARMAADDGRPLFLVLHTYRVHEPMRAGPEEDARICREEVMKLREKRKASGTTVEERSDPEYLALARGFYHDAVHDLDLVVGEWLDELEAAGFFEHGVVALTADHGNSYGENGQFGHGGALFDVKLRVPLAFAGRDIEPGAVRGVVSLIDFAPTLVALAGAPPPPAWPGRSLLAKPSPRPTYAFDLRKHYKQIALFAEGRKVMATDAAAFHAGEPTYAFDLAADPREEVNLATSKTWPAELCRTLASTLDPLLVPASSASPLELSPEVEQQLKAIGYGD